MVFERSHLVKRLLLKGSKPTTLVRFPMINVASWNIRGLNFTPKQNEVRQVISENNLSVFAILESHVVKSKLMKMCSLVFRHWDWTSNGLVNNIEVLDVQTRGFNFLGIKALKGFMDGILKVALPPGYHFKTILDTDPFNIRLREIEAANVVAFNQAVLDEEMFLKQKAKISWLKDGDSNTAYFHKSVKSRVSRSRIDVISNSDGIIFANDKVPDAFVAHYEAFLGQTGYTNGFDGSNLFSNCLDEQGAAHMVRTVTDHEIKEAMFSMGDEKSPGPDGFSAGIFQRRLWQLCGCDVIMYREFFTNRKRGLSHGDIRLVPLSLHSGYGGSSRLCSKERLWIRIAFLSIDEGGLGIRRLEHFNSALLVSHIWNLLSLKESLWVKWVHAYKLNGRNFWDVPIRGNMSWSWRKILQLRPSIREFIWRKIEYIHRVRPVLLSSQVGDVIRDGIWDRVSIWDYSNVLGSTCPLCEATPDSHEHLFFICPFANSVWSRMKVKAGLVSCCGSAYFIGNERNWEAFQDVEEVIDQVQAYTLCGIWHKDEVCIIHFPFCRIILEALKQGGASVKLS
ncbi:polypyrimidine tract-binding protein homolog 2 isoform X1 [Tanacetum coccineum]